jgi:tellurite resistance protein TehA-like permease
LSLMVLPTGWSGLGLRFINERCCGLCWLSQINLYTPVQWPLG